MHQVGRPVPGLENIYASIGALFPYKYTEGAILKGIEGGLAAHVCYFAISQLFNTSGALPLQSRAIDIQKNGFELTTFFWVCVLKPVVVEMCYRGILTAVIKALIKEPRGQNDLSIGSKVITSILSSAYFAAKHQQPTLPWRENGLIITKMLTSGCIFSTLREMTGNLWAPTVAHSVANTISYANIISAR